MRPLNSSSTPCLCSTPASSRGTGLFCHLGSGEEVGGGPATALSLEARRPRVSHAEGDRCVRCEGRLPPPGPPQRARGGDPRHPRGQGPGPFRLRGLDCCDSSDSFLGMHQEIIETENLRATVPLPACRQGTSGGGGSEVRIAEAG